MYVTVNEISASIKITIQKKNVFKVSVNSTNIIHISMDVDGGH